MTLAEAVETWLAAKAEARAAEARLAPAKARLLEHFRASGKTELKTKAGKVGYSVTHPVGLDTAAVRFEHGDRYDIAGTRETLSPL